MYQVSSETAELLVRSPGNGHARELKRTIVIKLSSVFRRKFQILNAGRDPHQNRIGVDEETAGRIEPSVGDIA